MQISKMMEKEKTALRPNRFFVSKITVHFLLHQSCSKEIRSHSSQISVPFEPVFWEMLREKIC
jgi:hypothetical protein